MRASFAFHREAPFSWFGRRGWRALVPALAVAVSLAGGVPLAAQTADLHVRQVSPEGGPNSDVESSQSFRAISPDGKWIVFHADVETDNVPEIYSARRFGGAPVRLSAVRPQSSDSLRPIQITPDSRHVIFSIDQETLGRQEIWSVPIQGPATAAAKLSPPTPLAAEAQGSPVISPGGEHVLFAFGVTGGTRELWSAPADGSAPAIRLSPDPPPGATGVGLQRFSAQRIVFSGDFATAGRAELWSAPYDGSALATRISGSMTSGGNVVEALFTPDELRVVYQADQRFNEQFELFSVPVTGPFSAAERVSPDLVAGGDADTPQISSDGTRVIFTADALVNDRVELWSAPLAGPAAAAIRLNEELVANGDVQPLFGFNELDGFVVFRADFQVDERFEVLLVPTAGPASASVNITGSMVAGGDVTGAAVVPVGSESYVIAVGDLRIDGKNEFHTAPGDGSGDLTPLFSAIPAGEDLHPNCAGEFVGEELVFCADAIDLGVVLAFRVPMNRSAEPEMISTGTAGAASDVTELDVDPSGTWAYFRWDREVDERHDLYRTRADGSGEPERIHAPPLPPGGDLFEDDSGFAFPPDGHGIYYLADHDVDEKLELWLADAMVFRADFEWGDLSEWTTSVP